MELRKNNIINLNFISFPGAGTVMDRLLPIVQGGKHSRGSLSSTPLSMKNFFNFLRQWFAASPSLAFAGPVIQGNTEDLCVTRHFTPIHVVPMHNGSKVVTLPDAPPSSPDVYCTAGDRPGEIDLQWDPVPGADTYLVECSTDRPTDWKNLGMTTNSKFTTENLRSGTLYWFRVYAINEAGRSKWSIPAMKIAP